MSPTIDSLIDVSTPPDDDLAGKPRKRRKRFSLLRFVALLLFALTMFAGGLGYWGYQEFSRDLPERWSELTAYNPPKASRVYSAEGELIGEFYLEKRVVIQFDKIPQHVAQAFIAAEDNRFYRHHGVDPLGILRAMVANFKAGRIVQGGSTITQQVAKLILVGNERKLERKIREALLAFKIERRLEKNDILRIYLNHVYLGHGAYGVQAAAEAYFAKDVENLSLAEAALIAGLPKAPSEDSPYRSFGRAKERQSYVLGQMRENGFITAAQEDAARKEPIAIVSRETPLNHVAAPYFVEFIRQQVTHSLAGENLYQTGLKIHTTLSMRQQRAAERAIRRGLIELDRKLGFHGPIGHLGNAERATFLAKGPMLYSHQPVEPQPGAVALIDAPYIAVVDTLRGQGGAIIVAIGGERWPVAPEDSALLLRWSHKGRRIRTGDLIPMRLDDIEIKHKRSVERVRMARLAQQPTVQAALVAVEPETGWLTAMVGGYDYDLSQFNRAVQARRQAGSSIKPYIYAAAIEKGFTEVSMVADAPIAVQTVAGVWAPHNYKNEFLGPVTLRKALAKSLNTVSVRLVQAVGLENTIEMMRRLGITSPVPRHISISLGVPELSPMEAAYAQATFPAGGLEVKPVFITRIYDAEGHVIEDHTMRPPRKRRIGEDTAYIVVDLMKNVVQNGTGRKAQELGRPVAGKTGTSNDFRDAWFVGYTTDLLAVVWVGRDDFKQIGHDTTGGQTALPLWLDFMQQAHPNTPVRDFMPPPSIVQVRGMSDTGTPAAPGTPGSTLIPFKRGTLPRSFAAGSSKASFADGVF